MPREREDVPGQPIPTSDVIMSSLIDAELHSFRLVNFPTGKTGPTSSHQAQLGTIYPALREPGVEVKIIGHASARNLSGNASLNSSLSMGRSVAIRDEILHNVPGATLTYEADGDEAAKRELKLGVVTSNSGFHRAVSVKVVRKRVQPPPIVPKKQLPFLIGIASKIKIDGFGMPAIPGGMGKQAAEKLLKKVPAQFRKLLKEAVKRLGKEMKDEFDLPAGLGVALVKISGDILIMDQTRKREAKSRFETMAVAATEGEIVVNTTLVNGGFVSFMSSETNDASTFTAGGAFMEFVIVRLEGNALASFHLTNVTPQGVPRMAPSRLSIPFKVSSGIAPLFVGVSDVKLSPA